MEILEFPCLLGVVFIPAFAICKTTKIITRAVPWELCLERFKMPRKSVRDKSWVCRCPLLGTVQGQLIRPVSSTWLHTSLWLEQSCAREKVDQEDPQECGSHLPWALRVTSELWELCSSCAQQGISWTLQISTCGGFRAQTRGSDPQTCWSIPSQRGKGN